MGTLQIFLCVFLGHSIAAQSVMNYQDAGFPQEFAGFFDHLMHFPFERDFDFTPYDTILSSWQTPAPDFHMLAELHPIKHFPRVQVFCNEMTLTLLVDKRTNGLKLTRQEIHLGDGCYSNSQLPNQFIFMYPFDQCGTKRVMQNGQEVLVNSLHLNLKKTLPTWWQIPSTVHVSCVPKRAHHDPGFFVSTPPANGKRFDIKVMTSSWTGTAESNVYKRGQVVNLQVSARTRPDQQLFIQSCFVSASPEPQKRLRHAVIMNKGCTASLGSSHTLSQFVASNRADTVNFVLNTSYLISELYIHCSVLISDSGVTFGSKSCNYNVNHSRWEEISGVDVCDCCSAKCKGLSLKNHPADVKGVVSTSLLVIVDDDDDERSPPPATEPPGPSSNPVPNSMQSDGAHLAEDQVVSGASVSRCNSSPQQGVVIVSQDPAARLTLWLPGQVQDAEHADNIGSQPEDTLTVQLLPSDISNDVPELQPSTTDQESPLNPAPNKTDGQSSNDNPMWDLQLLTMVSGWPIPPQPDAALIAEEFPSKNRFGRSEKFDTEDAQVDISLPAEMSVNYLVLIDSPTPPKPDDDAVAEESQSKKWRPAELDDFNHITDELAAAMPEETRDVPPIIRSKVEFSKGKDGSTKLSYEEEVKQQEGKVGRDGIKGKREPSLRGLHSTFLHLLRRMDPAE